MAFPEKEAQALIVQCHRRCCICHRFCGVKMELDHIVPREQDGRIGSRTRSRSVSSVTRRSICTMTSIPEGGSTAPRELRATRSNGFKSAGITQRGLLGYREVRRSAHCKLSWMNWSFKPGYRVKGGPGIARLSMPSRRTS